jgi:acyl-CoA hydrolase
MDIDIVVTEHGAADLRAKSHAARAEALIAIAAPDHRTALAEAWASYSTKL